MPSLVLDIDLFLRPGRESGLYAIADNGPGVVDRLFPVVTLSNMLSVVLISG